MKLIPLLIFIMHFNVAQSQEKKIQDDNKHLFTINYSHQYFINKPDVATLEGNKHFLVANNTTGYQVGIGYEYTNRYNIIFSVNTVYGIQNHDLFWKFTFDGFDPNINFGDYYTTHRFKATNNYLSNLYMIGYNFRATNKIKLQVKAGVGSTSRFKNIKEEKARYITYQHEPNVINVRQHAYHDAEAGTGARWFSDHAKYYSFFVGSSIIVNSKILKELGIGLQYNHVLNKNPLNISRSFYYNSVGERDGVQIYENKFRSVGVTFKLGF